MKLNIISFVVLSYILPPIFIVESKHVVKRVVGGFPASPGQFPFQISIRNQYGDHICGGIIIDKRFILTAGHCMKEEHPRDLFIVAGTNRLSEKPNIYNIEKIAHGNYNSIDFSNDISMIKVSEDIIFTNLIQPLSFHKSEPPVNVSMTVSGWGVRHFGFGFELPDELQYVEVKSLSFEECIERFRHTAIVKKITKKNICTFTKYGEGVCSGDSGGPLVYDGKLIGIVSHGIPCAVGYPDVFTKVSQFYNWIEATMNSM